MLEPLRQFICDSCGELIAKPTDGWLEWRAGKGAAPEGFRIVHHLPASPRHGCYYAPGELSPGNHLDGYLGIDGLVQLLAFLDDRNLPAKPDEVVEIIRRLHVPKYEEARQYWDQAEADGFFADASEHWPYLQAVLGAILDRYASP